MLAIINGKWVAGSSLVPPRSTTCQGASVIGNLVFGALSDRYMPHILGTIIVSRKGRDVVFVFKFFFYLLFTRASPRAQPSWDYGVEQAERAMALSSLLA